MKDNILNGLNDRDQDIDQILGILHQVPQVEIPVHFEARLKQALKDEGRNIAAQAGVTNKRINNKWIMRAALSIAACFVVGFVTINMYNDSIGLLSQDHAAQDSATEESMPSDNNVATLKDSGEIPDAEPKEIMIEQDGQKYGVEPFALGGESGNVAPDEPMEAEIKLRATGEDLDESQDINSPSRQGSIYNTMTDEYIFYNSLVNQYLEDMDFILISYTRDIPTGNHLYNVLILNDAEGNALNKSIIIVGAEGEVYEQQQEDQSISSD